MISLFLVSVLLTSVLSYPQRALYIQHPRPLSHSPGGLVNRPFYGQPQPQTHANLIQYPSSPQIHNNLIQAQPSRQNLFSSPNIISGHQSFPQGPQSFPQGPQSFPQGSQSFPQGPQSFPQGPQTFPQGAQPFSPYSNPRPLAPQTTVSTIQTFGHSIRNPFVPRPPAAAPARPQFQPPRVSGPQTFRRVVTIRQQPLMVQPNYYLLPNQAPAAPAPNSGATAAAQTARNAHLQALSEVLKEYEPTVLID